MKHCCVGCNPSHTKKTCLRKGGVIMHRLCCCEAYANKVPFLRKSYAILGVKTVVNAPYRPHPPPAMGGEPALFWSEPMPCMPPPCLRYGPPPPPPGPPGPPNEDEGAAVDRERPLATYDAAASLESSVWKKKETWLMTDHAKSARVVSIPRDHTDWRACRSPPRATYPTRAFTARSPGDAISQEEWRGTRKGRGREEGSRCRCLITLTLNPNPNTLTLTPGVSD